MSEYLYHNCIFLYDVVAWITYTHIAYKNSLLGLSDHVCITEFRKLVWLYQKDVQYIYINLPSYENGQYIHNKSYPTATNYYRYALFSNDMIYTELIKHAAKWKSFSEMATLTTIRNYAPSMRENRACIITLILYTDISYTVMGNCLHKIIKLSYVIIHPIPLDK